LGDASSTRTQGVRVVVFACVVTEELGYTSGSYSTTVYSLWLGRQM